MKRMECNRDDAIRQAVGKYESGEFLKILAHRISYRTESQNPTQASVLRAYLTDEIGPVLKKLGFHTRIRENPVVASAPMLIAERIEDSNLPTVLTYGHGDVVYGYDKQWRDGLNPWELVVEGDRWYGRGIADNKGQHSVNFSALEAVIDARNGKLGYNVKVIFETGEEIDSPGLKEVCRAEKVALFADLFVASDGPRVSAERPTLFLGSRGECNFELLVKLREGGHHSGNWGGVLRNPAVVLSHAIASLIDRNGRIAVEGLRPTEVPQAVRDALADIELGADASSPKIDPTWGETGLSSAEKVVAWNALEVLAMKSGNPESPVAAIPPFAMAACQLRFVENSDWMHIQEHLEAHFSRLGFAEIQVKVLPPAEATRLALDDPWVQWALTSMRESTGKKPALLPNLGGTVPNAIFANVLGLPTLWVPHSYPACSQHAPNEHFLGSVARESLAVMAGLWWDLGKDAQAIVASRKGRPESVRLS